MIRDSEMQLNLKMVAWDHKIDSKIELFIAKIQALIANSENHIGSLLSQEANSLLDEYRLLLAGSITKYKHQIEAISQLYSRSLQDFSETLDSLE